MKLLKPAFVHNSARPFFSIDIHPKEQKFVTVNKKVLQLKFPAKINGLFFSHREVKEMTLVASLFGISCQCFRKKLNWIPQCRKFYAKCK